MRNYFFAVLASFALLSCGRGTSPSSSTGPAYNEDLSQYRENYTVKETTPEDKTVTSEKASSKDLVAPAGHVTATINVLVDSIADQNKRVRFIDGYTIQVYSGKSREEAEAARTKLYNILPGSRPETKWVPPVFRVRLGKFANHLEAQKTFAKIKSDFPSAIVIPEQIPVF